MQAKHVDIEKPDWNFKSGGIALNRQDPDLIKFAFLSNTALFGQLTINDLDGLTRFAKFKSIRTGKVILHKATPGNHVCVITRGEVKLSAMSTDGKEIIFGILGAGEIFGELSILDGRYRSATVTAIEPTELIIITQRDFIPFLKRYPEVAIRLLTTLATRLRLTDEMCEDIFFRNLPSRLAKRILALAERYGQQTTAGIRINLRLSQRDLGNMVGVSRESINKQLRGWEDRNLIGLDQGCIVIKNTTELKYLSKHNPDRHCHTL